MLVSYHSLYKILAKQKIYLNSNFNMANFLWIIFHWWRIPVKRDKSKQLGLKLQLQRLQAMPQRKTKSIIDFIPAAIL